MGFPRYDIALSDEGKFVLARTDREDAGEAPLSSAAQEIVGVYESEDAARHRLMQMLSTPSRYKPADYDPNGPEH